MKVVRHSCLLGEGAGFRELPTITFSTYWLTQLETVYMLLDDLRSKMNQVESNPVAITVLPDVENVSEVDSGNESII